MTVKSYISSYKVNVPVKCTILSVLTLYWNDSVHINLGTQDDGHTLLKEPFKEPDVTAILLSLHTDVAELKSQRAEDVKTITGLKEKIESATQLQTWILTSVNAPRASLPPPELCSKVDKLLTLLTENSETNVHTDCVDVNVPMLINVPSESFPWRYPLYEHQIP